MATNPDLAYMLDHTARVDRPTESRGAGGLTTATFSSTVVGSVPVHVQPVGPREVQRFWGAEITGTHQAFFNSTVGVARGDRIKLTSGPYASEESLFWLRAVRSYNTALGEHKLALLDVTTEST